MPRDMVVVTCGSSDPDANVAEVCPGGQDGSGVAPDRTYYYLFTHDPRTSRR